MNSIIGLWLFSSMLYNNSPLPIPNPDLIMTFEFSEDGTDTLFYKRKGETGSCSRKAFYQFENGHLYQRVYWVNPSNAIWCDSDTDMRIGTEGTNTASINAKGELQLDLMMGEEVVTLIWQKKNEPVITE